MIGRIQVKGYRALRFIDQGLERFTILVGPNASGKSTFLDTIRLVSDIVREGLSGPVRSRAPDLASLFWKGEAAGIEIAIEILVPPEVTARVKGRRLGRARYELAFGLNGSGELGIQGETLWLLPSNGKPGQEDAGGRQGTLFPSPPSPPRHILWCEQARKTPAGGLKTVMKKPGGNDYFFSETTKWQNPFKLGSERTALGGLPEDRDRFPVSLWIRDLLREGVQRVFLNSEALRRPSPPGGPTRYLPDGSNLPWVVDSLRQRDGPKFEAWLEHVRTALPDIEAIETTERPEDRHRYLLLHYAGGLTLPSWAVSDGTLRLLALTLMAYIDEPGRIFLVEEPEDGIHPQAVETVFQSLSCAYTAQVLVTSHSPIVLSMARPEQLLCLARDPEGATDVVSGDRHPGLRDWKQGTDLGTLFAAGVLG